MTKAVIFISPNERDDRACAREGLDHTERRGYRFVAMLKDWDQVLDLLRRRLLSAIVFPGQTHRRQDAVEDTQILNLPRPARDVGEDRVPIVLSRAWVRELIDTDVTAPIGLDPESIAALRRISRRLGECGNG